MEKTNSIDVLSRILHKVAYMLLKEELFALRLRLRREKAIYYYKRLSKKIPPILFRALVVAEDERFFSHKGIDLKALLRVIWYYIRHRTIQGGSTIEQQLIRVVTNRYERTIRRKIHEILLAVCVKDVLRKKEVLGIYFNIAYFGYQMKGIEKACDDLKCNLETLSLKQAAGLITRIRYPKQIIESDQWKKSFEKRRHKIASLLEKALLTTRVEIDQKRDFLLPGSEVNKKLIDRYPSPRNFIEAGKMLDEKGKEALLRGFLSEGIPASFQKSSLFYENLREFIASSLKIHPKNVVLVGSARLGYSLAPQKYGQLMHKRSDLDLAIISSYLFEDAVKVFYKWKKDFMVSRVNPVSNREKKYWKRNLDEIPKNIERGFLDTIKIPNKYVFFSDIAKLCDSVKNEINKFSDSEVSKINKVSIRVYKNWHAFFIQNVLNLNYTIEEKLD
ncbi:MAG: biosynthetic peptidoglycan transglycosylase [Candidatus Nealsonbacteria bacterium]